MAGEHRAGAAATVADLATPAPARGALLGPVLARPHRHAAPAPYPCAAGRGVRRLCRPPDRGARHAILGPGVNRGGKAPAAWKAAAGAFFMPGASNAPREAAFTGPAAGTSSYPRAGDHLAKRPACTLRPRPPGHIPFGLQRQAQNTLLQQAGAAFKRRKLIKIAP